MPMFDETALHAAVTQALKDADIPEDHHNAFVLVATTAGTVKGVVSAKVNNVWTVDSYFKVAKGATVEAGAAVKATW